MSKQHIKNETCQRLAKQICNDLKFNNQLEQTQMSKNNEQNQLIATTETSSIFKNKFVIPIEIRNNENNTIKTEALVDSGAQQTFIDKDIVIKHQLETKPIPTPFKLSLADGSTPTQIIEETTTFEATIGNNHTEQLTCHITESLTQLVILGLD
jgi:hypothetical protein